MQLVDLAAYRTAIAAGRIHGAFSGSYRLVIGTGVSARIRVEYLDINGLARTTFDTGALSGTGTWATVSDQRALPTPVTRARVTLFTTFQGDTAFDGLQLRMIDTTAPAANDRQMSGPSAVAISANGELWVGANGLWRGDTAGTALTRVPNLGVYVAPKIVSAIARLSDGFLYFADPTSSKLHVRAANTTPYYADLHPVQTDQIVAVAAAPNGNNHRIWVAFRNSAQIAFYDCPKSNTIGAVVMCMRQGTIGGTRGFTNDLDGVAGGERFGYVNALTIGAFNDLFVSEESNHAVRRHLLPLTNTSAGSGVAGFVNGSSPTTRFNSPGGVAVTSAGNVVVADRMNNRIRSIGCGGINVCGAPVAGCTMSVVNDDNACTTDACMVLTARNEPVTTASPCGDGNLCRSPGSCQPNTGVCNLGAFKPLDDNDACTVDSCDPAVGVVVHTPTTPPADDGNPCTTATCDPATGLFSHVASAEGTMCGANRLCNHQATCEPAAPPVVAPPLDGTQGTGLGDTAKFIFEGPNRVQTDVTLNYIDLVHAGWLVGYVKTAEGNPMSNVEVSVAGNTNYGKTLTRSDGRFDLIVNGGTTHNLRFAKAGHLSADRRIYVGWEQTAALGNVVLLPLDPNPNPISSNSSVQQVATGSKELVDGERTARLVVPAKTNVVVNGASTPLADMTLRLTEYTGGPDGMKRMPAPLAERTAYTYAVEISVDEALSSNQIDFKDAAFAGNPSLAPAKEAYFYVDNFIGIPTGKPVPSGYYDRVKQAWIPSKSGLAIEILTVSGAQATVDVAGLGSPASAATLTSLGFTTEELTMLRNNYSAGTPLWRVPITHLTPYDCNWPTIPPPCEGTVCPEPPKPPPPPPPEPDCNDVGGAAASDSTKKGSIIGCDSRTLGEKITLAGSDFTLNYNTSRAPGFSGGSNIRVPITQAAVHSKLVEVEATIAIAGQRYQQFFRPVAPATTIAPNLNWDFDWDGLDGAGRRVIGSYTAAITLTARYKDAPYGVVNSFGDYVPANPTTVPNARGFIQYTSRYTQQMSVRLPEAGWQLGGWTLSEHHFFDATRKRLYYGSGGTKSAQVPTPVFKRILGDGVSSGFAADGTSALTPGTGLASQAFGYNRVAANGDVYFSDSGRYLVRKIDARTGLVATIAGMQDVWNACPNTPGGPSLGVGDGDDALLARLPVLQDIALDTDGSVYIVSGQAIRKATPKVGGGYKIETFAGSTCEIGQGGPGDGGRATAARFHIPSHLAIGADHSVYVIDAINYKVRRITPDGLIHTVAGTGAQPSNGAADGQIATNVPMDPKDIEVTAEGEIYISGFFPTTGGNGSSAIMRVDRTGILRRLTAVNSVDNPFGEGKKLSQQYLSPSTMALHSDGTLAFNGYDYSSGGTAHNLLRMADPGGVVTTLSFRSQGFLPVAEGLALSNGPDPERISFAPDGGIVASEFSAKSLYVVRRPDLSAVSACGTGSAYLVPDGEIAYCFEYSGRHKKTINERTGKALLTFDYEADGRIKTITNAFAQVTKIDKITTAPVRYEITAPHGQKTKINLNTTTGYASSIVDDLAAYTPTHLANGLLDKVLDRKQNLFDFDYDGDGFLKSDTSPVGTQSLDAILLANGRKVTHKTPLLLETTYERIRESSGLLRHTTTYPDLSKLIRTSSAAGEDITIAPDGTVTTAALAFDSGHQRAARGTTAIKLPSGLTLTTREERVAPSPISGGMTESVKVLYGTSADPPAHTATLSYGTNGADLPVIGAAQQVVVTTPEGRTATTLLDAFNRTLSQREGSLTPTVFTYETVTTSEDYGKLKKVARGARIATIEYQPKGAGTPPPDAGSVLRQTLPYSKTKFTRDIFGRPKAVLEAEGTTVAGTTALGFDFNGLLQSVKPPSASVAPPEHTLGYNGVDLLTLYAPPTLTELFDGKTTYVPDADRNIFTETRGKLLSTSTPVTITRTYTSGKLDKVTYPANGALYPAGSVDFDYYPATDLMGGAAGRVSAVKGPYTVNSAYSYDGRLTTKLAWSLDVVGNVSWVFNDRFLPTKETVSPAPAVGSATYSYAYDDDGLITCISSSTSNPCSPNTPADLVLGRTSPDHGKVTQLLIGATKPVKETLEYSDGGPDDAQGTDTDLATEKFGELRKQTLSADGIEVAAITYDAATERRDDLGRIQFKVEKFVGASTVTTEIAYGYDERNRLDFVETGVATETYAYDANGNRTAACTGLTAGVACMTTTPGAKVGVYDAQDRLTSYGGVPSVVGDLTFSYTANGELRTKSVKTAGSAAVWEFGYDPLGNLVTVSRPAGSILPTGTKPAAQYTYLVDGRGRRVGKKETIGATTTVKNRWLYRNGLSPVAELNSTGAVVARYLYSSRQNVPDLVVKGAKTFRLFTDHLGSPRMAVNVDDPTEIPYRVDYSAFGVPTWSGTGAAATPAFDWIPFGFGGGIYDQDTGLVRFGARDYDPTIGRWVSKDPILFDGRQTNLYVYVNNDPVNRQDPSGLAVWTCQSLAEDPFLRFFNLNHWWLKTDTAEAGMGGNVWGTNLQDHSGDFYTPAERDDIVCEEREHVDEDCVNRALAGIGRPLGAWGLTNNCISFVYDVLAECQTMSGSAPGPYDTHDIRSSSNL